MPKAPPGWFQSSRNISESSAGQETLATVLTVGNLKEMQGRKMFFAELLIDNIVRKSMCAEGFSGRFSVGDTIRIAGRIDLSRDWIFIYADSEITVSVPHRAGVEVERVLALEYVGAARERADRRVTANAWFENGWNVEIEDSVLRAFFNTSKKASSLEKMTYYELLGVSPREASDKVIDQCWRRFARQWHPDVCKEQNAAGIFDRGRKAHEVLCDPNRRRRYDAGLALVAHQTDDEKEDRPYAFLPPLRCGRLRVRGYDLGRKFHITQILAWDDITNARGQTMMTSWSKGAKMFETKWV